MIPGHVRLGLALAVLVAALDQGTKWLIVETVMQPPRIIPVTDFFNLVLGYNYGVSFGMLNMQSDMGRWILAALATAITIALLVWMWRADKRLVVVGLGLIVGGALGNVADRIMVGAVVDFLDFHAFGWHWPAFNVADVAIVTGAAGLIGDAFLATDEEPLGADEES